MQLGVYTSLALFVSSGMAAAAAATSGPSTDGSFTNGVPTCGVKCVESAITSSGCAASDAVCLCTTGSKAFSAAATTCLLQSSDCSAADLQTIQGLAQPRCAAVLAASGSSATASASSSAGAKVSSASSSSSSGSAAAQTGGAMQIGASLMAVGAGALAFVL